MINYVALVEKNKPDVLNDGSELIQMLKDNFKDEEEQLFLTNLFCYLKFKPEEFVINLDNIWKWCGFGRKGDCKNLLVNNFKDGTDYMITENSKENNISAYAEKLPGRPGEYIFLTIRCFKKLCLKAKTKKSNEIHDYYIRLEEIMNKLLIKQSEELTRKLLESEKKIEEGEKKIEEGEIRHEENLIKNFKRKPVIYVGLIESNIVKFGYTDNIEDRIKEHRYKSFKNFKLVYLYESFYNREIERRIKKHPNLNFTKLDNENKDGHHIELIQLSNEFTISNLDKIILEIKSKLESGEILQKELLELENENYQLKLEIEKLKRSDEIKLFELTKIIDEKNLEIEKLKHTISKYNESSQEEELKIVNIQSSSIVSKLDLELQNIKTKFCHNFLIDLVAKKILDNNKKIDISFVLSLNEILDLYRKFKTNTKFSERIYNDNYEKTFITKIFNNIDGIVNTYKTIDGYQGQAKIFYADKIFRWICLNLEIPRRFKVLFSEIPSIIKIMRDVEFVKRIYYILLTHDSILKIKVL